MKQIHVRFSPGLDLVGWLRQLPLDARDPNRATLALAIVETIPDATARQVRACLDGEATFRVCDDGETAEFAALGVKDGT